jgi:hypothetical protein
MLRHYTALEALELYDFDPAALSAVLDDGRATFFLADVSVLETQWGETGMGASYRWLREGPGLRPVATVGAWELFEVGQR